MIGIGATSIENNLLLADIGFDASPLTPEHPLRRAEGKQAERLMAHDRSNFQRWRSVDGNIWRRKRCQTNGTGATTRIQFCEHRIDGEVSSRRQSVIGSWNQAVGWF